MALKDRILTAIANTSAGEPFASPGAQQDKWAEELALAIGFRGVLVHDSSQSFTTGSLVNVQWDVEEYDTDGFYDSGSKTRLTIPIGSGVTKIRLTVGIAWSNFTTNPKSFLIDIKKNGVINPIGTPFFQGQGPDSSTTPGNAVPSAIIEVSEEDYFEIRVRQEGGSTETLVNDVSYFAIEVINE